MNNFTESEIEVYTLDELDLLGFFYNSSLLCDTLLPKLMSGEVRVKL